MIPVVLSGGSGTRLWPVSRAACPKQFVDLFEESLLRKTLRRVEALGLPWVVSVAEHRTLTARILAELALPARQALFEPVGRNTAPAVAFLCQHLLNHQQGDEIVGIFPADHLIEDEEEFQAVCQLAAACAGRNQVVTLGVRPTYPATGYGYIEVEAQVFAERGDHQALLTRSFHEKPTAAMAEQFFSWGNYFWNAGMFVFRVRVMAGHFRRLMPELWQRIEKLAPDLSNLAEIYRQLPDESIDYGIMEKLKEQVSIPCDLGWSDVGSWDEVARLSEGAPAVELDAHDNFVHPHGNRTYGLVGVSDLLIVDTQDALLITRRGHSQDVKALVEELKRTGSRSATEATREERPWGRFEVLRESEHWKVKVLQVDPCQQLSYQSHERRSEHWVIVRGRPEVVLDGEILHLGPGECVQIPQGARHRIRNPGSEVVELIEVQRGTYFGEDDITRFEDDYDRV